MNNRLEAFAARAARLSHDLRTPIGTIATALELMCAPGEDAALDPESREVIRRQLSRLLALAEEMRLLSEDMESENSA